jgi:hypothetical protein
MLNEPNKAGDWPEFMWRMRHRFEALLGSKPTCLQDIVHELCKDDDSITFLDIVRDSIPALKNTDLRALPGELQRQGYYASVQGPWLVCSKSKKQHDTMLFAAQAAQVLAASDMMLGPIANSRRTETSLAA